MQKVGNGNRRKIYQAIETERLNQVLKGYTSEHDDELFPGTLAYIANTKATQAMIQNDRNLLIQAAALIIAELERLDRATSKRRSENEV